MKELFKKMYLSDELENEVVMVGLKKELEVIAETQETTDKSEPGEYRYDLENGQVEITVDDEYDMIITKISYQNYLATISNVTSIVRGCYDKEFDIVQDDSGEIRNKFYDMYAAMHTTLQSRLLDWERRLVLDFYNNYLDSKLKSIIFICNMKQLCELAKVSYDTFKGYNTGRNKMNWQDKENLIVTFIHSVDL